MPQLLDGHRARGFIWDPDEASGVHLCLSRRRLAWNQAAELRVLLRTDG